MVWFVGIAGMYARTPIHDEQVAASRAQRRVIVGVHREALELW